MPSKHCANCKFYSFKDRLEGSWAYCSKKGYFKLNLVKPGNHICKEWEGGKQWRSTS